MEQYLKPFLYRNQERIPQKYYAVYDKIRSPDLYDLRRGEKWPPSPEVRTFDKDVLHPPYRFYFDVEGDSEGFLKYDCPANTSGSILVNERALELLQRVCPDDFEAFDAVIQTRDAVLENYKIINILKLVDCIDLEKSWCRYFESGNLRSVENLIIKEHCMEGVNLARDKNLHSLILFSPELVKAFHKEKIKGKRFLTDQEAYSKPFPEDYLSILYTNDPEGAKRYFVSTLNDREEYAFFKTRIPKIPHAILESLIDMTLSRSSFHKEQCEEIREILRKEE